MRKMIVGVMGPGQEARREDEDNAYELGGLIARAGWILLSGGRNAGVMDAVSRGAKEAGGLVIGVLPSENRAAISEAVDVAILTGMGSARNNINVLSSDVVLVCGMGPGTASETALAIKAGKPVVLLGAGGAAETFFKGLSPGRVHAVSTPQEAAQTAARMLA